MIAASQDPSIILHHHFFHVPNLSKTKHGQILLKGTMANPYTFALVLQPPILKLFHIFSCIFVSVCLSLFACMSLKDVAILYKRLVM